MQSDSQCLPVGYELEQYRIERLLGEGGFGLTYLATDQQLQKKVVIKENFPASLAERQEDGSVNPPRADTEIFDVLLKNFLKEARVLANFDHPNIVSVHTYFEANGTAYFVMPYLEGGSLKDLVIERGDEGVSLEEYRRLLLPLLDALDTLHQGKVGRGQKTEVEMAVYHRDIKPDNILIVEDHEGNWNPVLIDFGSARDINAYVNADDFAKTLLFQSGAFTPPEFAHNDLQAISPCSDLYSLGGSLYVCLTGDPFYDRAGLVDLTEKTDLVAKYGKPFLQLIIDSMKLSPRERPQSTDEWRERLAKSPEPGGTIGRRSVLFGIPVLIAILGLLIWFFHIEKDPKDAASDFPRMATREELDGKNFQLQAADGNFLSAEIEYLGVRQIIEGRVYYPIAAKTQPADPQEIEQAQQWTFIYREEEDAFRMHIAHEKAGIFKLLIMTRPDQHAYFADWNRGWTGSEVWKPLQFPDGTYLLQNQAKGFVLLPQPETGVPVAKVMSEVGDDPKARWRILPVSQ